MKKRELIIYWISTILIAGAMLFSAYHLLTVPDIDAMMGHMGFPGYFGIELGIAKGLGALVLLIPNLPRLLKGFAYAGFTIALVSAIIAHVAVDDPISAPLKATVFLALLTVSYLYLPKEKVG